MSTALADGVSRIQSKTRFVLILFLRELLLTTTTGPPALEAPWAGLDEELKGREKLFQVFKLMIESFKIEDLPDLFEMRKYRVGTLPNEIRSEKFRTSCLKMCSKFSEVS